MVATGAGEPVVVDRQLRPDATVLAVEAHTVDTRELHEEVMRGAKGLRFSSPAHERGTFAGAYAMWVQPRFFVTSPATDPRRADSVHYQLSNETQLIHI